MLTIHVNKNGTAWKQEWKLGAEHDMSYARSQHGGVAVVEVRIRTTSHSRLQHLSGPDTGFRQGMGASSLGSSHYHKNAAPPRSSAIYISN